MLQQVRSWLLPRSAAVHLPLRPRLARHRLLPQLWLQQPFYLLEGSQCLRQLPELDHRRILSVLQVCKSRLIFNLSGSFITKNYIFILIFLELVVMVMQLPPTVAKDVIAMATALRSWTSVTQSLVSATVRIILSEPTVINVKKAIMEILGNLFFWL